ncbi:methyl-accepting chemotaxis protein [Paenibacillus turpanensis]|uniref:methyl-accepting chemotaxis protein n=1 Tax=Paenibacillus turpanensis TaxID=2689078 RepID=UPI00140C566C|nr:methyl-accepting chemotaxis protein [Paenibacillus turpanensis]
MGVLRNLKVVQKLFIIICMAVVFLAFVGGTGFFYLNQNNSELNEMYEEGLLPVKWINAARAHSRAIEAQTFRMMLADEKDDRQKAINEIAKRVSEYDEMMTSVKETNLDSHLSEQITKLEAITKDYRLERQKVIELTLSGKQDEAYQYFMQKAVGYLEQNNDLLSEIADYIAKDADESNQTAQSNYMEAVVIIIAAIAVAIVLCGALGYWIARTITRPLAELERVAAAAADKDLTVRSTYRSKDELGALAASFNRMLEDTSAVIKQIHSASEQVAASSEQLTASAEQTGQASENIALASQEVAAGAADQSNKVQEGLSIASSIAGDASVASNNAQVATAAALQTAELAQSGREKIGNASQKMDFIYETVEGMAEVIQKLGKQSEQIGGIVGMMTEIANQTNLLALNASIEAARAGEHGLGFAVVAQEVRKLADQSIQAAQQVNELVQGIQQQTKAAVTSTQQTADEVSGGLRIVHEAGESFQQIGGSITELAEQMQQVTDNVVRMASGTETVASLIRDIHKIAEEASSGTHNVSAATQEQLATMEEMSASSEYLAQMAQEMQQLIGQFKV